MSRGRHEAGAGAGDSPWARTSDRHVSRVYKNGLMLTVTRIGANHWVAVVGGEGVPGDPRHWRLGSPPGGGRTKALAVRHETSARTLRAGHTLHGQCRVLKASKAYGGEDEDR
jgi:hypothetical protein